MKRLKLPLGNKDINGLKAGDSVLISGKIYTARDAVHKILAGLINKRRALPVSLKNAAVYYAGPTPSRPGAVIGACGPTTSSRMDSFTPILLKKGMKVMIGKGRRAGFVRDSIKRHKAVYFIAPAGCGALLSKCIRKSRLIAYKELGPEAIYELELEDFPAIVGIDSKGRDIL